MLSDHGIIGKCRTTSMMPLAVHWLTVHPSGRLALSIGADKTIKTWNLIKGKHAYTTNISSVVPRPEFIEWSCCGEYFGLVCGSNVEIYSMMTGSVNNTLKTGSRITCVNFMQDQKICVGTWEGAVRCYDFLTGDKIWEIEPTKEVRIKAVSVVGSWLVVANSEGYIFVYALKKTKKPVEKASVGTSCRITCLGISRLLSEEELKEVRKKRKKKRVRKSKNEVTADTEGTAEQASRTVDLVTPKTNKKRKTSVGTPQNEWNVTPIPAGS